jgi:hypothetical protein
MATLLELTPPRKPFVVRYATLHDEPGYAILTPAREVLFVDHDAHFTALGAGDAPALVLLGDVDLAEKQNVLDTLRGGAAAVACSRKMEVA